MEQGELINAAARLINTASAKCQAEDSKGATVSLKELRDLLNDPAKFEAAGPGEKPDEGATS
ncbi:hypothetical protein ES703_19511 [subsurface metagenome]